MAEVKNIKIAAGTQSKKKILYLKSVLKKLKIVSEVIPLNVRSGVNHQPRTSEETEKGSLNRAKGAINQIADADIGIGIEMGGDFNDKGKRETFCWVSIVDKEGHEFSARSFSLKQPKLYADILREGSTLGDYRHEFKNNYKHKGFVYEHLGKMLEYRRPFIVNAIECALIYYFCRDEF
jgi:non-canonical (house-cleaning) NTP pyrophosphatase